MLFPINYTINLIIGFAGLFIASIGFFFMKEPETEAVADSDESLKTFFKKIPKILKNDNEFRRFIIVENLSSFGIMIMPFYIVFAREVLFIQDKYIGIFLLIQISGKIISTILWGLIGKKWDSRTVVTICIVIGGFIPILAILLSIYLPSLFGIVFFLLGFTISGRQIGFSPYLLDIAPKDKRVEYLGIRGSMNIFIVVLPLLGAIFIKSFGYIPTFILVSIILLSTAAYHRFFKVKVNIIS
jgi:MFS family permease